MSFEKESIKDPLEKGSLESPEVRSSFANDISSHIPPQIFTSEVRHSIAAELDIADEKRADLLFQQAEQISDEEAEDIMREVLEEHGHSTLSL
jgi:hypothetical protein